MSSLDLEMEGPLDTFSEKISPILRGFLQPDTAMTLKSTANSILDLLPEKAPNSTNVWTFGEIYVELAEQIPYHHPSQLKLTGLLEYLGRSTKLGQIDTLKGTNTSQYWRYQRLGESIRDSYMAPDPDYPRKCVNFHAFVANLDERRVIPTNPTWAIWAQRDAHETSREEQGSVRDAYILVAVQWILWYRQSFFEQILFPGDVSPDTLRMWSPGPLYDGKTFLSLQRWHSWRDSFKAVAYEGKDEKEGFGQECKDVAAEAVDMMDSLEKNMTF